MLCFKVPDFERRTLLEPPFERGLVRYDLEAPVSIFVPIIDSNALLGALPQAIDQRLGENAVAILLPFFRELDGRRGRKDVAAEGIREPLERAFAVNRFVNARNRSRNDNNRELESAAARGFLEDTAAPAAP